MVGYSLAVHEVKSDEYDHNTINIKCHVYKW